MFDILINDYQKEKFNHTAALEQSQRLQKQYEGMLKNAQKELAQQSFFKRMFPGELGKKIDDIQNRLEKEQQTISHLQSTEKAASQALMASYVNKLIFQSPQSQASYEKITERVSQINGLFNTVKNALEAGNQATQALFEALESIKTAQSNETLDMVLNNQAISFISHASTTTAKAKTQEAANAVSQFKEQLEITKLQLQDFTLDDSWSQIDFMVDMFSSGSFLGTLSSFMALQKLDNAHTQLENAYQKTQALITPLNEQYDEIQKQKKQETQALNQFLLNYQLQAKHELQAQGIDISLDHPLFNDNSTTVSIQKPRKFK